jgi:cytochrome c oxidase subunit 2
MAIAVALLLIVIGSVVFQLVSPWGLTPLASNWSTMDHTMVITLVITGIFFVVINLFVVYTVIRFRHRKGQRAAYEPENPRLEKWLIGVTTVGVVALLAPGLVVYAAYVNPPHDAMVLEIIGQQWQWRYRFPGPDGKLGATDARFVSPANPLGLDPDDVTGRENIIVNGNEVHLPVNKPVRVLLRSHDVLHDFFVPQFRARMNIVPGQVSSFWFTPTQVGRYEGMCAQLCGVGHPNMRGTVIVEDEMKFATWLKTQPTFAATRTPATLPKVGDPEPGSPAALGKSLAQGKGCVACHSVDGSRGAGPTWQGLFGKTESLADGSSAPVDDAFLKNEIRNPQARIVKGYAPIMPKVEMSDEELDALVAYIKSQKAPGAQTAPIQKAQQ